MTIEAKVQNPLHIKVGKSISIIIVNEHEEKVLQLNKGVMFKDDHYGFSLIIDHNGRQKEILYQTQSPIRAVAEEQRTLAIYEDGKEKPWRFNKYGILMYNPIDEFSKEGRDKLNEKLIAKKYAEFMGEPALINPLRIKIAKDPEKSLILSDDEIKEDYPLYPGALLGTIHFGFVLIIETEDGEIVKEYPTQNKIDAIGIEGNINDDIKVFEDGKYHPWIFTNGGELKQTSSFFIHSKQDRDYIEECYNMNKANDEDCFSIKKKR